MTKRDGSECIYMIQLETVISGHDGWIYGVHWKPNFCTGKLFKKKINSIYLYQCFQPYGMQNCIDELKAYHKINRLTIQFIY